VPKYYLSSDALSSKENSMTFIEWEFSTVVTRKIILRGCDAM